MVVTINSKSTPEEIDQGIKKLQSGEDSTTHKHFDAFKYCGVIKLKEDPLDIQKHMRDEWE